MIEDEQVIQDPFLPHLSPYLPHPSYLLFLPYPSYPLSHPPPILPPSLPPSPTPPPLSPSNLHQSPIHLYIQFLTFYCDKCEFKTHRKDNEFIHKPVVYESESVNSERGHVNRMLYIQKCVFFVL